MKLLLEWIQNLYLMTRHHQIHQLMLSLPYAILHVDFETIPAADTKSIQNAVKTFKLLPTYLSDYSMWLQA